jgi:hypothetical protein
MEEEKKTPKDQTEEELHNKFEALWLDDMPSKGPRIIEKIEYRQEPEPEPIVVTKVITKEAPKARTIINETITEEGEENTTEVNRNIRRIKRRSRPAIRTVIEKESKPKVEEEPENLVPVHERFEDMKSMIQLIVKKVRPSYFISGKSGASKSHTVLFTMDQLGLVEGKDYFLAKGTASPVGIYSTLYKWNGKTVIFDDADSAFKDKTSTNLLKSALDSTQVRRICWITQTNFDPTTKNEEEIKELLDKGKLPTFFDFTGGVIFVSNIPFSEVDTAIKTRSLVQDIQLTQEEMFDEMQRNLPTIHPNVPMEFKQKVLDTIRKGYANKNKEISFRTLVTAIALAASDTENWERLVTRYG